MFRWKVHYVLIKDSRVFHKCETIKAWTKEGAETKWRMLQLKDTSHFLRVV